MAVEMIERKRGAVPLEGLTSETEAAGRDHITERLYRCTNGLQLGARRGGRLHGADATTWEIFVLSSNSVLVGAPVGFVTDEQLEQAVVRLDAIELPKEDS